MKTFYLDDAHICMSSSCLLAFFFFFLCLRKRWGSDSTTEKMHVGIWGFC